MAISINGTTGISGVDGSAATPALQGSDTNTGISFGADTVNVNTGGSTRATVDSSGRLLVGTSSVSSDSTAVFVGRSDGATSAPNLRLEANFTPADGNSLGALLISQTGQTGQNASVRIEGRRDGGTWTSGSSMPGRLVFSTTADGASSPTERMRITSLGQVIIGTTSAGNLSDKGFRVATSSDSSSDYAAEFYSNSSTLLMLRNDGYFRSPIIYNRTSGGSANIFVDSSGYVYRSTSSQRYKRDIQPANYTLEQIDALSPVTYKSSIADPDGNESNRVFGGLIAEDVDAAGLQEFVDYDEQGRPDALQYGHMISVAIKGLQEAHTRIKELEAKVAALESA